MGKLDKFFLNCLHRLSNWTYKNFNTDNFTIATFILVVSVIISIYSGVEAHKLASQEIDPNIARFRDTSAFMGVGFSSIIAIYMIFLKRYIARILTQARDLGKRDRLIWGATTFVRWFVILLFFVSLPFQSKWYGMLDMTLICVAGWFLACDPPDMELRMKKEFGNEEFKI